jgi:hypothetical protein
MNGLTFGYSKMKGGDVFLPVLILRLLPAVEDKTTKIAVPSIPVGSDTQALSYLHVGMPA